MSTIEVTFDFACRDDCLDRMVPSDLRALVAERDRLRIELERLTAQLREADSRYMALLKAVADLQAMRPRTVVLDFCNCPQYTQKEPQG